MSPTHNRSSVLQPFECGNVVEMLNRMIFDFYPALPHVWTVHNFRNIFKNTKSYTQLKNISRATFKAYRHTSRAWRNKKTQKKSRNLSMYNDIQWYSILHWQLYARWRCSHHKSCLKYCWFIFIIQCPMYVTSAI